MRYVYYLNDYFFLAIYEDQDESDGKKNNKLFYLDCIHTYTLFVYYVFIPVTMQGSVVTHLISQVKIGMDLTKVALPTFILERRSLLEMYADYLAHPDLFLK